MTNHTITIKRFIPRPLWPYLGATFRRLRTLPPRTLLQKKRVLADSSLGDRERELLERTSSLIYYDDRMYTGDGAHYFRVGLSAIHCIDEAIERAKVQNLRDILDLPCGGGRVLRFLRTRFPAAEITACELGSGAVQFCACAFQAAPASSSRNLEEVSLGKRFDLIWCGSLATHLNERGMRDLFRLFHRHLRSGGLVTFTTHGDYVARRIPQREFDYMLNEEQTDRIGSAYRQTGYAFEEYVGEKGWGVSLTSPGWIRARMRELGGMREVYFSERGWDRHQDVFGFVRESYQQISR